MESEVEFRTVRLLLRGRHTPLRKRSIDAAHQSTCPQPSEASLEPLFCEAVAIAKQRFGAAKLWPEVWSGLTALLPMIIAAQTVLLDAECLRRKVVERRRGRVSNVRFQSYDLSTLDPPSVHVAASHEAEQRVVDVLVQLVLAQQQWLGCGRCARLFPPASAQLLARFGPSAPHP
jgi:hypothetical protein